MSIQRGRALVPKKRETLDALSTVCVRANAGVSLWAAGLSITGIGVWWGIERVHWNAFFFFSFSLHLRAASIIYFSPRTLFFRLSNSICLFAVFRLPHTRDNCRWFSDEFMIKIKFIGNHKPKWPIRVIRFRRCEHSLFRRSVLFLSPSPHFTFHFSFVFLFVRSYALEWRKDLPFANPFHRYGVQIVGLPVCEGIRAHN